MQKQIGSVRETQTLKKNQKKMLKTKNTLTEMKNGLDGLINKVDMAEKTISKWEDISMESLKTRKREQQQQKPGQSIQGLWDI